MSDQKEFVRSDVCYEVLFDSLDEVCRGIVAYGDGPAAALGHNAAQMSGMGAVLLLMNDASRGRGSFAERVAAEARAAIEAGKSYSGDWDYDGPGPFHKCSLEVKPVGRGGQQALHIHAAYVGNQPELRLAETLGRPTGLGRVEMSRAFAVAEGGDRFSIPWSEIEVLWHAVGAEPPTPEEFLAITRSRAEDGHDSKEATPALIRAFDGFAAHVGIDQYSVHPRYDRNVGERDVEWRIEGDHLTGPCRMGRYSVPVEVPNPNYGKEIERDGDDRRQSRRSFSPDGRIVSVDGDRWYSDYADGYGRRVETDRRRTVTVDEVRFRPEPVKVTVTVSPQRAPSFFSGDREETRARAEEIGAGAVFAAMERAEADNDEAARSAAWQKLRFEFDRFDHPVFDQSAKDRILAVAATLETAFRPLPDVGPAAEEGASPRP
jgi:hypothetical protein